MLPSAKQEAVVTLIVNTSTMQFFQRSVQAAWVISVIFSSNVDKDRNVHMLCHSLELLDVLGLCVARCLLCKFPASCDARNVQEAQLFVASQGNEMFCLASRSWRCANASALDRCALPSCYLLRS